MFLRSVCERSGMRPGCQYDIDMVGGTADEDYANLVQNGIWKFTLNNA